VAVERALPALGFTDVSGVHVGRLVELDVEDAEQLVPMCEKLLANPLVEDYEIVLVDGERTGRTGRHSLRSPPRTGQPPLR
jgi:phosphoribosylformylglycinamidine synthase